MTMTTTSEPVTTKRCTICGTDKPLDEFYERPDAIDGLRNDCKACNNARPRQSTLDRVLRSRAHARATRDLIKEHRDQFDALHTRHRAAAKTEAGTTTLPRALRSRVRAPAVRDLIDTHRNEFDTLHTRHLAAAKTEAVQLD
jgi:hypothetical protein